MNARFYDAATVAAVTLTPIAPAVFFGSAVYSAAADFVPMPALAVAGAIATALGWELVGILAGHVTLALLRQQNRFWLLGALTLAVYAGLGAWELPGVLRIAFAASLLSYLVAGLRHVHDRLDADARAQADQQQADRADERAARRAAREAERQRAHELQLLAQSQHRAEPEPAQSGASGRACEDCGRTFATTQAANAHRRFCPDAPAMSSSPTPTTAERANGYHKETP